MDNENEPKSGFFARLKSGLTKTRSSLAGGFDNIVHGKAKVGPELLEELEETLLIADVGMQTTSFILDDLKREVSQNRVRENKEVLEQLKQRMTHVLSQNQKALAFSEHQPFVILVVGVNGSGKTTTIGKLARHWKQEGKKVLKDPLYCYPGGETFYENYLSTIQGVHDISENHLGSHVSLFTHSSMMRALMIYLDMRPFAEAYNEYMSYQENQDNIILLVYEEGTFSSYSCAVGLSKEELQAREKAEKERQDQEDHLRSIIEISRSEVNRIAMITSGGDSPGMNAVLKSFIDKCLSLGVTPYIYRKGIEGVLKNDGQEYTEEAQRRLMATPGSVIQCNKRFKLIEQEGAEFKAIENLRKNKCDALIIVGGDGSVRLSDKLFQAGYPVVALPGTIDNDLPVYCLGFDSALNATIELIQMLEWTSRSMERVHLAEVYGAGSGHFALTLAHAVNPQAVLVNEMKDIGIDIDEFIDNYLIDKLTLG